MRHKIQKNVSLEIIPGHITIDIYPVSILRKSISGRHRPVRVADGPMTARCRFTLNASWVRADRFCSAILT